MADYKFDTSGKLNSLNAILQSFADTASFGLAPKGSAYVASKMYGVPYQDALDAEKQYQSQLAADHPYANAIGTIGGMFGNPVGDVGGATRLARMGRNALLGGATGAANEVAEGGGVGAPTAMAAGVGALTGAAAGPVGEYVGGKLQVAGNAALRGIDRLSGGRLGAGTPNLNAWRTVAKKVGIEPEELFRRFGDYTNATQGRPPALAQLLTPDEAQKLRSVASKAPELGQQIRAYSRSVAGTDASADEIESVTRRTMDKVMSAPGRNGLPMRDQPVEIPASLMSDPDFLDSLRHASSKPIMRQLQASEAQLGRPVLPLKQADALRQTLNDLHMSSPSGRYNTVREQLVSDLDRQLPGYGSVIRNFGEGMQAGGGFRAAMRGHGPSQTGPMTQAEQTGFTAGAATKRGQDAVANATPSQTASEQNMSPVATEIGLGMAHIGHGSPFLGMAHILNGSRVLTGGNLGTGAQRALAGGLLSRDPAAVQQSLLRLGAARGSLSLSSRVGGNVAGNAGAAVGTTPGITGVAQPAAPVSGDFHYARPKAAATPGGGQSEGGFFYARPRKK